MEIIAQFIQNSNTLNSLIYYITTNLKSLTINNDVNPKLIPDKWIKLLKIANGY